MAKMEKMDSNDPDMPKMLDGNAVATCLKANLSIDMNNPDDVECRLLDVAHDLVVGDDPDMQQIGRELKPLISGFCEALREHNKSKASNGVFINTLINFAGMALGMSINACAKPSMRTRMADEAVNGIKETIAHSLSSRKAMPRQQEALALDLLAQFIASKQKGKLDA